MATAVATTSAAAAQQQPKNTKQMQSLVEGLNTMRQEQRALSSKLVELESDMNEHRLVLDALKQAPQDRKCFRMIGGVLLEHKVNTVIPDLEKNFELLQKTIEMYEAKIKEKGTQINEYVKTHNLVSLLRGAEAAPGPSPAAVTEGVKKDSTDSSVKTGSVLV